MVTIPPEFRDLLDRPITVSLATVMADGQPQVQPVWCSYDGRHVLVNTEKGRQKYRNLSRRKLATILAVEPGNDNRWLEIRGVVVAETEAGADAHIDQLARLYLGVDSYPYHAPGDVRVMFRIEPRRIATMGTTMPGLDLPD
ncbi:MAG: PPOX class F420-dependent oxidoreductase [Chromatiales bacterium]|jgi:PPOX class probable F420-dependent enzyme|nr:PPOX class F420-dependent oxidoreductase [Chromatiales bacterium]